MKTTNHSCECIKKFLKISKIPLRYNAIERRYTFFLHSNLYQRISHCPWCGKKLPKELKSIYLKILKKEYGEEDAIEAQNNLNIPKEFKSDEWWKNRGL